jgi:N,N'-diacetyllegionaminate synthase
MMDTVTGAFIIAEVAQAHDGNLNIAHAFVDAVAKTGADAIKFQTHYAAEETSLAEPWRKRFSWIDDTRYGYWQRMEFTPEQWKGLARHAEDVDLEFMSSSFSLKANEVLADCGMTYWKIASGELTNYPLIDDICRRGGTMILSCGLAEEDEIARTVARIRHRGGKVMSVLECTSKYPTPLEEIDLDRMRARAAELDVPFGLSDHSADPLPSICAMAFGANVIEVHVTMHEDFFGPDNPASLTLSQIRELVSVRDRLVRLKAPVHRDTSSRNRMKQIFRKSIYLSRDVQRGQPLTLENLAFRKPMADIGAEAYEDVLGRTASKDLVADAPLTWKDLQ